MLKLKKDERARHLVGALQYTVMSGAALVGYITHLPNGRFEWTIVIGCQGDPDGPTRNEVDTLGEAKGEFRARWQKWLDRAALKDADYCLYCLEKKHA